MYRRIGHAGIGGGHERPDRRRPTAHLHRHRGDRQLHQGRRGRAQDPVGGVDADEAARGAARQADLRARRPRLEAHRGRRPAARLRAAHHQAQRRGARRLRRRRACRPRAARPARRLRRPLSARDHGAVLTRLSERRAHRDVRAVGRAGRADRFQRARSRHRHRLRHLARVGSVPPRAAVVGDVEPPFGPSGGAAAARARPAELRLAARRDRMPGDDRAAASHRLHQRQRQRGRLRGAVGAGGFDISGIGAAAGHARAQSRRTAFRNCRAAASGSSAIRTRAWRWRMRWPSTSSRRSTTCRKPRKRRSRFSAATCSASS